ncbi:MAG: Catechol 2,3-dioxygenase-like protein [Anaerolineales bacterium]|nr:Catechol 2,3-dioxygenase-like protein [Anaerolineales bacterium]
MGIGITQVHHIQIFVPREVEQEAKHFYGDVLGLEEIPKPEAWRKNGGAWYRHGPNQLHLSLLRQPEDNRGSQRHVCYMVADLENAEKIMREAGVEIVPDDRPFDQWTRFYVRDPGGNYIEIAQMNAEKRGS